jgi:hypothetical protein
LRTVLYSTYNSINDHIFQGVATLASHELSSGSTAQPVGFLGGKSGASIRSKSDIPKAFLRKERGTDIIVLGFRKDENWQKDLTYAVLEHFWPAIEWGDLTVKVGSEEISKKNLSRLLERFSGEEDFTAYWYYQSYKKPTNTFKEGLDFLKNVNLYLAAGDNDMPKRVAMVRRTGMIIFAKPFRSLVSFCGVFVCRNETGNRLLRKMEPPRHDFWDPNHPEKGQNKPIESEYSHFIRECIRKLAPLDEATTISIPGLNKFLPDDEDSPEDAFDEGQESRGEGYERRPLPDKIPGRKLDTQPAPAISEEGGGEGPGGGGGKGSGRSADGSKVGSEGKPGIPIRYRTFATDISMGTYLVTLRPEEKFNKKVKVAVWLVGDDQRSLAEIQSARLPNGIRVAVNPGGLLGPLQLASSVPLKIEVRLREPLRVAMEITAHEA